MSHRNILKNSIKTQILYNFQRFIFYLIIKLQMLNTNERNPKYEKIFSPLKSCETCQLPAADDIIYNQKQMKNGGDHNV